MIAYLIWCGVEHALFPPPDVSKEVQASKGFFCARKCKGINSERGLTVQEMEK